jgi:hypothetical protein
MVVRIDKLKIIKIMLILFLRKAAVELQFIMIVLKRNKVIMDLE